jgi:hypothetical protein
LAKTQANIAERNWQTENEKVVLELMERRLAIYRNIREVIAEVMRTGKSDDNVFRRYLEATDQIPYLFGPEVETYLDQMRVHLADLQLGNDMMADTTSPDYQKGVQLRAREFKEPLRTKGSTKLTSMRGSARKFRMVPGERTSPNAIVTSSTVSIFGSRAALAA